MSIDASNLVKLLTAFKHQPQLSQKQIEKIAATRSLIHCIMHPSARFVELLLTHDTSGSLQSLFNLVKLTVLSQ